MRKQDNSFGGIFAIPEVFKDIAANPKMMTKQ